MMGAFGRFLELSVPTADILRSLAFYRELGFAELTTGDIRRHHYAVVTDGVIPIGLHAGGIDEILNELRRAHEVLVRDDVLQQAVDTLTIGLQEVANALLGNSGACDRLIRVLGVGGKSKADASTSV